MLNTKNINKTKEMAITPDQRKTKVNALREEHEDYFQTNGIINALYIPKMAYRPTGKDELYVSFFPSEFEKEEDIDEEPEDWEFSGEEWKDGFNPKTSGEEWKNIDDD